MASIEDRFYVSTVAVQGPRPLPTILERLASIGITRVELSAPHPHLPEPELVALLKSWQPHLSFVLHNYFPCPKEDFVLNIASPDAETRGRSEALVASACAVANAVGSPVYGIHSGYLADAEATRDGKFVFHRDRVGGVSECLGRTVQFVTELLYKNLPPRGGLLLENLFPSETGENFSLACTPHDIAELFAAIDDRRVSLLLDFSHFELTCNIFGLQHDRALDDLLARMADRIGGIHMSGNDGLRDIHLPVGADGWPLKALERICETKRDIIVTLESRRLDDEQILRQRDMILEAMA